MYIWLLFTSYAIRYATINIIGRGLGHFRALLRDCLHFDWSVTPGKPFPYELFMSKLQRKSQASETCTTSREGQRKPRYYLKKRPE